MQNSIYMTQLIGKMHAVMNVAALALITLGIVTQIGLLDWQSQLQFFHLSKSFS
jgi:hypothetical protein